MRTHTHTPLAHTHSQHTHTTHTHTTHTTHTFTITLLRWFAPQRYLHTRHSHTLIHLPTHALTHSTVLPTCTTCRWHCSPRRLASALLACPLLSARAKPCRGIAHVQGCPSCRVATTLPGCNGRSAQVFGRKKQRSRLVKFIDNKLAPLPGCRMITVPESRGLTKHEDHMMFS